MEIRQHVRNSQEIAEITADGIILNSIGDGLDLMATMYFQGYHGMILYRENISPDFFDLSSGMAGEILQKFSNYRMKLAILGDFRASSSKSLQDFIYESNKMGQISFVNSIEEALTKMTV